MVTNREYELTYGLEDDCYVDFRGRQRRCRRHPRHRSAWSCTWLIQAVCKARWAHFDHFGSFPHTIYLSADDFGRLIRELSVWSDTVSCFHGRDLRIEGMLVKVDER